ncbi:Tail protein [Bacillus phage MG-B1]|uniref:Tail protein n=1 Tax=Bacillus phage MG-B1 TaxID=1309583 RepID=M4W9Q4_9CAUD|nr:tail protein [Bacillus phage MG-B1]AGI10618.1 Tail protein [Bacillus phage MG-B1]
MAVVPVSGSSVFFKKGVPFSNDYKNTRWFENATDQLNYFSTRPTVHSMGEVTFVENDGKSYVSADASIDELRDVSYMMFQNAGYNNKWFYAFVTKLTRKSSNTTYVYFEIDVLQTWLFNIEWKPSFVVREHCPLWNADGSPVVNTIDEGLNYGSEYETVEVKHHILNAGIRFLVIATKKAIHGTSKGNVMPSIVGVGQPFSYYVLPFVDKDEVVWATIQGERHRMSTLIDTLQGLYKDQDFTNNIATMFITENIGLSVSGSDAGGEYQIGFTDPSQIVEYAEGGEGAKMVYVSDAKNFLPKTTFIGKKYDGYRDVKESKLLMYPYTVLTLDDMQGNRRDYKNEYISRPDISVVSKGSLGTSNKMSYSISGYNMDVNTNMHQYLTDEWGIQNINPNDVSILTDMISAFIQGNKNSLLNQKDQIMLQGYAGLGQSALSGAGSVMQGGAGGVLGGASAGVSVIKGAGSTVLALQGIEAKIDDIRNLPPQLNKMGTNTSYDIGNGFKGVFLIKKQIKAEYQKKLEDFFNMFGYKKNEVKIPNFHTRQNWNYVETKNCNLIGHFNTEDLNELKAVFDRGITLWHTNDIGNYALSNEVI